MPAAIHDFVCDQGATFARRITLKYAGHPIDLTPYTARMQVRDEPGGTKRFDLTTENGGITLGGVAGTIDLRISATAAAACSAGNYRYDLELATGGVVIKPMRGAFSVRAEITA